MPDQDDNRPQFHPRNVIDPKLAGKHCWHPAPPPPVGFRNRRTGNELICCFCGVEAMACVELQSWHGRFAAQQSILPFGYIEGHDEDEPCPGPPAEKSRLVLQ